MILPYCVLQSQASYLSNQGAIAEDCFFGDDPSTAYEGTMLCRMTVRKTEHRGRIGVEETEDDVKHILFVLTGTVNNTKTRLFRVVMAEDSKTHVSDQRG